MVDLMGGFTDRGAIEQNRLNLGASGSSWRQNYHSSPEAAHAASNPAFSITDRGGWRHDIPILAGTQTIGPSITDGRLFVTRISIVDDDSSGPATVNVLANSQGFWQVDGSAHAGGVYRQNTMFGITATWTDTGVTGQRVGFIILNIQVWGPVNDDELETNTRPTDYDGWQQWFVRVDLVNRAASGSGNDGSAQDDGNMAQGGFRWPIHGNVQNLENDFGAFRQRGANRGYHLGLDIMAPAGTLVFPVANGRVVWSGSVQGSPGFAAIVEHTTTLQINGVGQTTRWRSWYMYLASAPPLQQWTTQVPLSTIVSYPGGVPDHLHIEISMSPRATWSAAEPIRTGTRTVRQLEIDSDRIHPMRLWRPINANRVLT